MTPCGDCAGAPAAVAIARKTTRVAIVGPPNSGKSTLFNRLTGLRQKVANYPGVTVEQRWAKLQMSRGVQVDLVDLPGIYSLDPRSEDEQVTHDVLHGRMQGRARPDAVLLILDATNLGRHLMLAAPILSLGLPTLVVLNMADDLARRGGEIDTAAIAEKLGAPVVLISAARGEGIEPVTEFLSGAFGVPKPVELPVLNDLPKCRAWAAQVSQGAYNRSGAAGVEPPAGCSLLASGGRAAGFSGGCDRSVSEHLHGGGSHDGRHEFAGGAFGTLGGRHAAAVRVSRPAGGRRVGRRGFGGGVPAADSGAVPVYRRAGGLRLPGAGGGDRGSNHGARGAAGEVVHPAVIGIRLRDSGHHGGPDDREQARPDGDDSDCAVHDVLGAAAGVCPGDRGVHPGAPLFWVRSGTQAMALLGLYVLGFVAAVATARLLKSSILKSERDDVRAGVAAVPLANAAIAWGCGCWTARRCSCDARER